MELATATAAEVGKIQKFGRYAQAFCVVAFAMLAIMGPATIVYVLLTPGWEGFTVHLGPYDMRGDIVPPLGLQIWALICSAVLGVIPATAVSFVDFGIRPDSFTLMIAAGLILLVSWIMEIGRRTSEDAEQLRRESELVV